MSRILLLVNLQNDFVDPSSLCYMKGSEEIIDKINNIVEREPFNFIIACNEWHPKGHITFASAHNKQAGDFLDTWQGKYLLLPDHCVQNTNGAKLSPRVNDKNINFIYHYATEKNDDGTLFYNSGNSDRLELNDFLHYADRFYLAGCFPNHSLKNNLFTIKRITHVYACMDLISFPEEHNDELDAFRNDGYTTDGF
jgi:nicotinamidase/pyrazinamidase